MSDDDHSEEDQHDDDDKNEDNQLHEYLLSGMETEFQKLVGPLGFEPRTDGLKVSASCRTAKVNC